MHARLRASPSLVEEDGSQSKSEANKPDEDNPRSHRDVEEPEELGRATPTDPGNETRARVVGRVGTRNSPSADGARPNADVPERGRDGGRPRDGPGHGKEIDDPSRGEAHHEEHVEHGEDGHDDA